MTDTDTAVCPICRGTVATFDDDRRLEQATPTRRLVEHVDTTGLRCEGSFADADHSRRVPTYGGGFIEIAHGDNCLVVIQHISGILTPDAARTLARILERQADAAEQAG